MCETFARWRRAGHGELPWLAGSGLAALASAGIRPSTTASIGTLERFLVGAETDPTTVLDALDRCVAAAGDEPGPLPPDVRGALVDAADRFFDLLAEAYGAMHVAARDDDRTRADDVAAQWRSHLEAAAEDIDDRAAVLLGLRRSTVAGSGRAVSDHVGLAVGFVVVAVLTAAVVMWLVLHGWPMESPRLSL